MTNEKNREDKWRGNLYDWLAPKLSTEERDTLDNLLLCTENAAKAEAVQAERERCIKRVIDETTRYWCDNIENKTLGGYHDAVRSAILTAEPEPCESFEEDFNDAAYEAAHEIDIDACQWEEHHFDEQKAADIIKDKMRPFVDIQVADRRAEELRAQLDRANTTLEEVAAQRNRAMEDVEALREFIADAVEWSTAYPEHIFTAPTPEQVDAVCKTLGFRIDRIAAMVLREFTGRWSEKARSLLAATEPKP